MTRHAAGGGGISLPSPAVCDQAVSLKVRY
jgi:hypothetical protein